MILLQKFQSTLPRGSDCRQGPHPPISGRFQSTLPRGSDRACVKQSAVEAISIHAPSRERRQLLFVMQLWRYFNPRSLAGATVNIHHAAMRAKISIHAPSRERPYQGYNRLTDPLFQSTLPRGSDAKFANGLILQWDFNPRSLAGATHWSNHVNSYTPISIHAPSRERRRTIAR